MSSFNLLSPPTFTTATFSNPEYNYFVGVHYASSSSSVTHPHHLKDIKTIRATPPQYVLCHLLFCGMAPRDVERGVFGRLKILSDDIILFGGTKYKTGPKPIKSVCDKTVIKVSCKRTSCRKASYLLVSQCGKPTSKQTDTLNMV